MKHARDDYNRFQDPAINDPSLLGEGSSPIAEDEPVILFRAKDRHFVNILSHYEDLLNADDNLSNMQYDRLSSAVKEQMARAEKWQAEHGIHSPDMPANTDTSESGEVEGR